MQNRPIFSAPLKNILTAIGISLFIFVFACAGFESPPAIPWTGKAAGQGSDNDPRQVAAIPGESEFLTSGAVEEAPLATEPEPFSEEFQPAGGGMKTPENGSASGSEPEAETAPQTLEDFQAKLDEALEFCQVAQDFWQKGELDNAIDALDQAYALTLDVDTKGLPKLIQQKEDLRFMISKRILEIYASRHIVVNGNHNAIPITINNHVQQEIDLFTRGKERKFFIESYKRAGRYRPLILPYLEEAGLPSELSWLPLIESGFKIRALSRARALGLWQFIPSTGYKFGLKRDTFIDERLDPDKATKAAVAYLKELHQIFGDWTTVLAAYNCGEGRVLNVIRNQNVNYLDNFWDLYELLPRETARYVPRFLATLHIINNLEKYGMADIEPYDPFPYETVTIARQVDLKHICKTIGVDEQLLKDLNPELRYAILPPESYDLRVPLAMSAPLMAAISKIPVAEPQQRAFVYHRVRRGETLSTIARRYRTSVWRIAQANNIHRKNYIVAGKLLKIPTSASYVPSYSPGRTVKAGQTKTHVVKSGDSLWILAKRYGTTTRIIQELNRLSDTRLSIGQVLKIPGHDETQLASGFKQYTVRRGDNPFDIARRHNMSLDRFLRINHLNRNSRIYPGQSLYVE